MTKLNLLQPRTEQHNDSHVEWQKVIPRWLLLVILSLMICAVGWLAAKLDRYSQSEMATRNARDLYASGLSERIATVEADVRVLKEANKETNESLKKATAEMKSLALTSERLATKVEILTSTIRRSQ